MAIEKSFKLRIKLHQIELRDLLIYIQESIHLFPDEGPELFIRRELLRISDRITRRTSGHQIKNLNTQMTFTWYEFQALKYLYNNFMVGDLTMVPVIYGRMDSALPFGVTIKN